MLLYVSMLCPIWVLFRNTNIVCWKKQLFFMLLFSNLVISMLFSRSFCLNVCYYVSGIVLAENDYETLKSSELMNDYVVFYKAISLYLTSCHIYVIPLLMFLYVVCYLSLFHLFMVKHIFMFSLANKQFSVFCLKFFCF